MDQVARDFFVRLLETPSPSGYEREIQEVVRAYAGEFADEVRTDSHGNVIACDQRGRAAAAPVRRALRSDRAPGQHIDDRGFLYTQTIGGWDPQQLIGQRMTVWTKKRSAAGGDRAQADPPARGRGAQAGGEGEEPLARHRSEVERGGEGARARR